ncbi:RNA 3'-phosphate cyclase, partial [Candidatus Woesearchaeota archaeon]|nr:RNA 3'-phosphate cyclase [Candidatus Woesearchaeota archaeon]
MILIDGSHGEGGGAILRQSLGLSILTRKAVKITNIRANRPKPGLSWQHLHALNAAARLCNAKVSGNTQGSTEVTFEPGKISTNKLDIDVGTAGSVTLVLQTLLLPLLFHQEKISVRIKGGTDVKWSIPFDYFKNVLLPHLTPYAELDIKLIKRGFYPKGGGEILFTCKGKHQPENAPQLRKVTQGELFKITGLSYASAELQKNEVAERQAEGVRLILGQLHTTIDLQASYVQSTSMGSGITLWARFGDKEGFTTAILGASELGEREIKAEKVGERAAKELKTIIESGAVV